MWKRLQRFRALSPEARKNFFRAAVLLPAISVSLRIRGFRATQQALLKFIKSSKAHQPLPEHEAKSHRVAAAVRMVNAAARNGCGGFTCLEKSLVLWWLLLRQGIASTVRIGARRAEGKFEAHAWVEFEGMALNEPQQEHRHFAPFDAEFPVHNSETS